VRDLAACALALALVTGSCGGSDEELPRLIVDCTAGAAACDDLPDSGCSVDVSLIDEEGNVIGGCGGDELRICTTHCEEDGDCPDGWTCLLPNGCPGDNTVRFCVPTATELQLQELESCRADADPEVCGFF
jgi:hypothetical protein